MPSSGGSLVRRSYTAADLKAERGLLEVLVRAAAPAAVAVAIAAGLTFLMVQLGR
jgi:hypothetical protein